MTDEFRRAQHAIRKICVHATPVGSNNGLHGKVSAKTLCRRRARKLLAESLRRGAVTRGF